MLTVSNVMNKQACNNRLNGMTRLCLLALAAIVSLDAPVQAQNYPDRPVKIIVDSGAGSATDIAARLMADRLS